MPQRLFAPPCFISLFVLACALWPATAEGGPRPRRKAARGAATAQLQPGVQKRLDAALRDMRRAGIRPKITSGFRTTAQQRQLYKCGQSPPCRKRRGLYGAKRPGTSLHEAGLAVDIAGISYKRGRQRRVTPQGRRVVRIMAKHGFRWPYGLKDPAHFESNPRGAGYRSVAAAIRAKQRGPARLQDKSAIVRVKATAQRKRPTRQRNLAVRAEPARPRA